MSLSSLVNDLATRVAQEFNTIRGEMGGGGSPIIFFAQSADTNNLSTSLATLDWATPIITDAAFTESGGVITIGSALNGRIVRIDWSIQCAGASSRVEVRSELQVNTVAVAVSNNYTARNGTQDTGGITGYHYLVLSTGDVIRIRALRDGSNANKIVIGTSIAIETK